MARENRNEDRKQRIRDAFQEGQTVERMPAREDMAPQQPEDVECRVAPYCRVSTQEEQQIGSFDMQIHHFTKRIEANPQWQLVEIYQDEGISATTVEKRLCFQKMITDAVDGKIEIKTAELIQFDFSGAAKF